MGNFRSDTNAGICPEAVEAIVQASKGHDAAYGDDTHTKRATKLFRAIFGHDTQVFFVVTGTAANTLAIASLTASWQRVLCHEYSHYALDESTAPEHLTGCRISTISTPTSKIGPEDIEQQAACIGHGIHTPQPGVVTITNPTEFGEVYTPEETHAICRTAHDLGYRVHVDGARFANATAHLGCDPPAIANEAGADALTFGGTKNGLAFGEAVLFFPQGDGSIAARAAEAFPYYRKATGHLLSKHRFITSPFVAAIENGAWLRHAAHANAMATRLADALTRAGHRPDYPTESTSVFIRLPESVHKHLATRNHFYHLLGRPEWKMARFMMSFDTDPDAVDALAYDVIDCFPEPTSDDRPLVSNSP